MKKCKCEHWETCRVCYPQGFDERGIRKPVEIPPTRDELLARIKEMKAERDELAEKLKYASMAATAEAHRCDELAAQVEKMRGALSFYAEGSHFVLADPEAWDTVSGEPPNYYEDESNTATIEDGSIAKAALALPDLSTGILNKVRAEALRKAAAICNELCEPTLLALAADMEAGKC